MSLSDRYPDDPALRGRGEKPTDRALPIRRRTVSGPYLVAILIVAAVGVALVSFGVMRFSQSTSQISNTPGALAPSEQIAPATDDSNSLRDDESGNTAPDYGEPATNPRPGASDVPGGG